MSPQGKLWTALIVSLFLLGVMSGCLKSEDDGSDDENEEEIDYVPHTQNNNISLGIIKSYTTDHLEGIDDEGNEFTVQPTGLNQFRVVILNITNTNYQYGIDTGEEQIQMFDNKDRDRSLTYLEHGNIKDPNTGERYDMKNFNFTNISDYLNLSVRPLSPGGTKKLASVGMTPPGAIRKIVIGFKIMKPGQFAPFQKVSITLDV